MAKYEEQQKEDLLRAALSGGGDAKSCTPQQQHQPKDQEIKSGKMKRPRPPYDLPRKVKGVCVGFATKEPPGTKFSRRASRFDDGSGTGTLAPCCWCLLFALPVDRAELMSPSSCSPDPSCDSLYDAKRSGEFGSWRLARFRSPNCTQVQATPNRQGECKRGGARWLHPDGRVPDACRTMDARRATSEH